MLTRRSLIGGTAALGPRISIGCSFSAPGIVSEPEVNWAVRIAASNRAVGMNPETYLHQAVATLAEDEENPLGPKRAHYTLNMKYHGTPIASDLARWLEDNELDL